MRSWDMVAESFRRNVLFSSTSANPHLSRWYKFPAEIVRYFQQDLGVIHHNLLGLSAHGLETFFLGQELEWDLAVLDHRHHVRPQTQPAKD